MLSVDVTSSEGSVRRIRQPSAMHPAHQRIVQSHKKKKSGKTRNLSVRRPAESKVHQSMMLTLSTLYDRAVASTVESRSARGDSKDERRVAGTTSSTAPLASPSLPEDLQCVMRMISSASPSGDSAGADVPKVLTPELLQLAKGLVPGNKVYRFNMVASTTIGTTAGGSLLQAISLSPSLVTYQEWPALSGLFDEVKLHKAYLTLAPLVGSNGQNLSATSAGYLSSNDIWIGCNHLNISTAPAAFAAVVRQSPSYPVVRCVGDVGRHHRLTFTPPRDRDWSPVSAPASTSPPAGCVGSFDVANASVLAGSAVYYFVVLQAVVDLRCRI